jgi:hypothetical protein
LGTVLRQVRLGLRNLLCAVALSFGNIALDLSGRFGPVATGQQ